VLSIEGRPKFHADSGVFKGRKAVQVKEIITDRPAPREAAAPTPPPAAAPAKKK
jgi:flagellar motor switch protein FliM